MSDVPSQTELIAIGISQPYASMILRDKRKPSLRAAIHIFRNTGWRHPLIAELSDEQIATLETVHPWMEAA